MNKQKLLEIINKYVGYAEEEIYDAVEEYEQEKIKFAKYHCEAALKEASKNTEHHYANKDWVNKELILNAYPLTNIK